MPKKVRLRLHVECDLLCTRITPSSRRRDPELAVKRWGPHRLTAYQRDLWLRIAGDKPPQTWTTDPITEDEVLHLVRDSLPAQAEINVERGSLSSMFEIICPFPVRKAEQQS